MKLNYAVKLCLSLILVCFFTTTGFCDSSYDREMIVKDKTRAIQVEGVFKELMAAYEDEDARGFLDLVSDERFRQDYITFTDALYSDFRNYEIHNVDYWIDRVVPDHVKQFLYVRWEKRYENLDDGQQLTQQGFSRFLFDEVDGKYLLVELAGNHLWGASLQEWREEVPQISGQEMVQSSADAVCDAQNLSLCDGANCSSNGGYWYGGSCHQTPYMPSAVCDPYNLYLCGSADCSSNGGYWYDDTCNSTPPPISGAPDLEFTSVFYSSSDISFRVTNTGTAASVSTAFSGASGTIPALNPLEETSSSYSVSTISQAGAPISGQVIIDPDYFTEDSDRSNNTLDY